MDDSLQLKLKPQWEELNKVREAVETFLSKHHMSIDDIHAMMMVSSELVENAIKYLNAHGWDDTIDYFIDIEENNIIVEVKNRVVGEDDLHLKKLDATIQWIRSFQNPLQAYVERLKLVSSKDTGSEESGLGMTRIAYEGQSLIDFYVDENNILAMSAVYQR